ncbi:MAG: polymer-forming cytoskeletal protein [Pseudomonadota bacterium]
MWKKEDASQMQPEPMLRPNVTTAEPRNERATIGPSISIKGDLSGDEDLTIEGRVEGKVDLKQHKITVGRKGVVRADMHAKVISIEGEVQGTLTAEEQIVLCKSSNVRGDIIAPRVTLEDGAKFKGSIDMEGKPQEKVRPAMEGKAGVGGAF